MTFHSKEEALADDLGFEGANLLFIIGSLRMFSF
ncbi:hypothetical protein BVRB_9g206930 [Beta vulgaris subsp. vulgaris]|uniref:Uncharacterized protein n=1 Tax=Beta vulgaris subsp. vulgaris TaxID=3555 RepID=A0A0J8BL98_BETVV|nr:hypothetical protein BVRB_9g206930 [Beta vulgaris subsp. vulgaris]